MKTKIGQIEKGGQGEKEKHQQPDMSNILTLVFS